MTPAEAYTLYANDYLAEDEVETVTLTPQPGSLLAAVPTAKAKFGELSKRELAMLSTELLANPFDAVVTLYDATLSGLLPEARYMITRGTEKWNVAAAVRCKHGTQWVCTVTRGR